MPAKPTRIPVPASCLTKTGRFEFLPLPASGNPRLLALWERSISRQFNLEDISHALSRIVRFGGHAGHSIGLTVGQHLLLAGELMKIFRPARRDLLLAAYTHDFAEAYLGDIPHPLKTSPMFADYARYEKHLQAAIGKWLGVQDGLYSSVEVRTIDLYSVSLEGTEAFGERWHVAEELRNRPAPFPEEAKGLLDMVAALRPEYVAESLMMRVFKLLVDLEMWPREKEGEGAEVRGGDDDGAPENTAGKEYVQ